VSKKITELSAVTVLAEDDVVPVVDISEAASGSAKMTLAKLREALFNVPDDIDIGFGGSLGSEDSKIRWDNANQTNAALEMAISGSNNIIITTITNINDDHAVANSTNPQLLIFSAYSPVLNATRYIAIYHTGGAAAGEGVIKVGSGLLHLGASGGTPSAWMVDDGDVYIKKRLEVTAGIWASTSGLGIWSGNWFYAGNQDTGIVFGSSGDSASISNQEGIGDALLIGGKGSCQVVIVGDRARHDKNYGHGNQTNPTLYTHSIENPDTNNDCWISFSHYGTNAVADDGYIRTGMGTINLVAAGQGIEIWHSAEAANDYVAIYHNGSSGYMISQSGSLYLSGNTGGFLSITANGSWKGADSTTWGGSIMLLGGDTSTTGNDAGGVGFFGGWNTTDSSRIGAVIVGSPVDQIVSKYTAAFTNQIDPRFAVFSHEDPDTITTAWISLRHKGTNAVADDAYIESGMGTINLVAAGQGIEIWHSAEAANDYVAIYHDSTDAHISPESGILIVHSVIRASSAVYWYCKYMDAQSLAPGASGAIWTTPDANTLGGWQLDAYTENLYFDAAIESNWDAASDLEVEITFEVNIDNTGSGSAVGDTVDLQLITYYKGNEEIVNKTQTLEEAIVVGQSAQYKQFRCIFTIDYDLVDNIIDALDRISFILNLETDTSEVDNVIINHSLLRYKTKNVGIEV
jgi:hypothetical protein